ncbi:glycosyltransferase family 2 protein [Aeromonas sp. Prich7-2]|uniref:glycosyltransferase family 2 protein n=1 Tax=Aeromonas sp. Prich7-2 TaxID=2823361 RepID=UPI001B336281|nr:glycosyltransferase family 2 protein [Aeromonas sp. Prich7-2]MBP4060797.1 glycosyltransferase family 2 protein [Aeromonas sp. Prich7-2]
MSSEVKVSVCGLRSESQIMSGWLGDIKRPVVTIICTAYNHELYIEGAIVGFLMQETNFPFEIIIHDDASADNTAVIIGEYAKKYPNIIKPILQSENQFSRLGMQMVIDLCNSCSGDYVAICEGDDYWISSNKLQKQYDLLEADESLSICIHNALRKNLYTGEENKFNDKNIPKRLSSVDVVGRAWFSPTASFFFRKTNIPIIPPGINGDLFILFECSKIGAVGYLDELWSVYRFGTEGSLSNSSNQSMLYRKKIRFLLYAARRKVSVSLIAFYGILKSLIAMLVK